MGFIHPVDGTTPDNGCHGSRGQIENIEPCNVCGGCKVSGIEMDSVIINVMTPGDGRGAIGGASSM